MCHKFLSGYIIYGFEKIGLLLNEGVYIIAAMSGFCLYMDLAYLLYGYALVSIPFLWFRKAMS